MECSIQHLTYNYASPDKIKQLNLTSASNIKIYQIKELDDFVNLRVLVLSNNMISLMKGLDKLLHLRILNLEFNRIRIVEGTQRLAQLEELYMGYNEVQIISNSILCNTKLRVLHLAYNDIKTLDSVATLYKVKDEDHSPASRAFYLAGLTTLSLQGNPITSTITYLTFFKMLIPSLRYMDDKNVDDDLFNMASVVCPQEEVVILREAINKLLDERNEAVAQLETFLESPLLRQQMKQNQSKCKKNQIKGLINQNSDTQHEQFQFRRQNNHEILEYLKSAKKKYQQRLGNHRQRISKISQLYTQNLKKGKSSKKENVGEESQFKESDSFQSENQIASPQQGWPQKNKEIIRELKLEDQKLQQSQQKIANISKILDYIHQRMKDSNQIDISKIILQVVLFGYMKNSLSVSDYSRLCKKYLIKQSVQPVDSQFTVIGLIQYSQLLKKVIYGESNDKCQKVEYFEVLKLKKKIRNKGLLEIIAQLKQLSAEESEKFSKFQREKKDFVERFEKQSEQLSRAWDEFKEEKEKYKIQKERQQKQTMESVIRREQDLRKKYKAVEQEERLKILELKKIRQKQEDQLENIKYQLAQAQEKLNRKFLELEQFETHFNQFIDEKEHIKSLEDEINQITHSMSNQKEKYQNLVDKVKQLTLEQGIIQSKLIKVTDSLKLKQQDLIGVENLKAEAARLYDKYKSETAKQSEKLRDITTEVYSKIEQLKDYQKHGQRLKKNLGLLEQKVRNIQQMEESKKGSIKQLEEDIKRLKEDRQILAEETEGLEKKLEGKREELMKCQMKIQQTRLSMSNLSDINRNISDMLIRQSELKRSIIELEIENKNLLEMKNNLVDDYRIKNYL